MTTTGLERVKEIFDDASALSAAQRVEFVRTACNGNAQLRAEVEALLAAHDSAGRFLSSPTLGDAAPSRVSDDRDVFARVQRALAGRFSLEREIGRGGMGIVYLARDLALDRAVAIKVLPPALSPQPEAVARFIREARTAAGLAHPNIVPIHLVEESAGLIYFVMTFVDGESVGDRVRRTGPLAPGAVAKIVQEVAWALAYAHSRGVIHRDIKPDNILLDSGSGRALVADFGIARITTGATMSQQGEMLGTLRYMSPEQMNPDSAIDGRADLYSLGVTAFFALTGRLPFDSHNPVALMAMHVTEPAPPLRSVRPQVPARLAEVIDRCLAKNPDARFADGAALAESLAESQTVPREIAPSVREFLSAARSGVAQLIAVTVLWWGVALALPRMMPRGPLMGHPLDPVFMILAWITLLVLARPVHAARGVVRAGLGEGDVAEAAVAMANARDVNVDYTLARVERLGRLLSYAVVRMFFIGLGALVVWWITTKGILPAFGSARALQWTVWFAMLTGIGSGAFFVALAIVPKRVIAGLTRGTPQYARWLRKIWAGPFGRWLFRIAGIGLARSKASTVSHAEPTEVLLGRAADQLFEQLSGDQRARLREVPAVIKRLEGIAVSLRARRDELAHAAADAGAPGGSERRARVMGELDDARRDIDDRLSSAMGALENIRLDLLRLRAGIGHADDLTGSIEEARAIGDAVDAEVAGQQQVRKITVSGTARHRVDS